MAILAQKSLASQIKGSAPRERGSGEKTSSAQRKIVQTQGLVRAKIDSMVMNPIIVKQNRINKLQKQANCGIRGDDMDSEQCEPEEEQEDDVPQPESSSPVVVENDETMSPTTQDINRDLYGTMPVAMVNEVRQTDESVTVDQ